MIRDTLHLINEICQLICNSPKRNLIFTRLKDEMATGSPGLRPLCPTRWTVRTRAFESIIANYECLLLTFTEISDTCHDEYGRRAAGIVSQMEKFVTFFSIKLGHMIFGATEEVSRALQRVDITIGEGMKHAKVAMGGRRS